jgi:hypothetical protein
LLGRFFALRNDQVHCASSQALYDSLVHGDRSQVSYRDPPAQARLAPASCARSREPRRFPFPARS